MVMHFCHPHTQEVSAGEARIQGHLGFLKLSQNKYNVCITHYTQYCVTAMSRAVLCEAQEMIVCIGQLRWSFRLLVVLGSKPREL